MLTRLFAQVFLQLRQPPPAQADAWASQVVERGGKFYWYAAVEHRTVPGRASRVATSDIDPTVFLDGGGQLANVA